jgi:hypothetical protein
MLHKHNADRRHHIAKMAHRVTNWPEYEAGLRSRGSPTLWITPEALAQWPALRRTTPGGEARYSGLATETTLMLGSALRMRLRQAEGLLGSVVQLTGLTGVRSCETGPPTQRDRHPDAQQTEAAIGVAVLNRMLAAARPKSVRRKVPAA